MELEQMESEELIAWLVHNGIKPHNLRELHNPARIRVQYKARGGVEFMTIHFKKWQDMTEFTLDFKKAVMIAHERKNATSKTLA